MSLTKLTANLNNVQTLADKPSLTASQLKAVFDAAGNTIKAYINEDLTDEIDTIVTGINNDLTGKGTAIGTLNTLTGTMKTKLDGIENNANNYVHPTTSGNKHIPSGGSSGKILKWSADGTAIWDTEKDTTYSAATQSVAGLMSAADKKKLDGVAANANNYSLPTAGSSLGGVKTTSTVTSNSGYTACPIISGVPYYKDTNTTYNVATASSNGLMSSTMVTKLNGIATGATKNTVENVLTSTSTTNALSAAQGKALQDTKQKAITSGTAAPSGGSNGDIYIQYFT